MADIYDGSRTIEYELNETFITGISSIEQTETSEVSGGNNVLTFTFSNGETATLTVKNGGSGGQPIPVEYAADMIDQEKIYLYLGSEEGYENGYLYAFLNNQWENTSLYGVGQDGYSPELTVNEVEGGVEVRVIDQSGISTAVVENGTATDEQVAEWLDNHPEATTTVQDDSITVDKLASDTIALINRKGGLTEDIKQALLNCFKYVAFINNQGQTYVDALEEALYPATNLASISATFNQGANVIYDNASLDDLKQYLTVIANYTDSTHETLYDYTLSGTLEAGTSTITVSYGGKTTTFNVTVTAVALTSIQATFTQGSAEIYETDTLDSLNQYLTVTARYSDGSSETVSSTDYTLSGTLAVGTSTITVSYEGLTDTFNVTVSEFSYDINSWTDGVAYNLKWCEGEVWNPNTGAITETADRSRTGYINCEGASTITFTIPGGSIGASNVWFDSSKTRIASFRPNAGTNALSVPEGACYFALTADDAKVPYVAATPNA